MEQNVQYGNFNPSFLDHESCSKFAGIVRDLAPADSKVVAWVDRLADGTFRSAISIKAACGKFYSEAFDFSPAAAVKGAHRAILDSLEEWKSLRFK